MNINNQILNELQELGPLLAAVPRVNVYATYDNYFAEMSEAIMAKLNVTELASKEEYNLPAGYFENLSDTILQKVRANDVVDELTSISKTVANIGNKNVYSVANNYFEKLKLHEEVTNEVANELSSISKTVANIGNKNVYSVADNYFETLILEKVKSDDVAVELNSISKTVANIGNKNVYSVADSYFETLHAPMPEKQIAKVVAFGTKKILKLAAAAVVTGLLGLGIFTFVNKKAVTNAETASIIKEADKILTANSFDATFATLTDKDLEKYLVQNGEDVNASMVASAAENTELPDAIDYYLDPNTLNDFLDKNNLKN